MKPVSVRLSDDLAAALEAEASRQGVGVSDLIRTGIVLRLALAAVLEAADEGEDAVSLVRAALHHAAHDGRTR